MENNSKNMSARSKKVTETVSDSHIAEDSTLWQEWSDATLNKENWAHPKNGPDGLFLDGQVVQLPPSLEPSAWIRATNLENLTRPLVVFAAGYEYPDLITNNKHLLHSEVIEYLKFARWFISALINLQYCGQGGLEVSGESGNFIWNGRTQPWRGWMNVYSMNKAGKGAQHRPVVNPNGKYVVRLYFLGCWRRIVVDDTIPVNSDRLPLLPRTASNFELWPMILSKALLKLCALTWTEQSEIVDFHPVTCLTGWVCLRLDIGYLSPQDKWDFVRKYAEHFEWKPDVTEQKSHEALMSNKSKEGEKSEETMQSRMSKVSEEKSKITEKSKKSKDSVKRMKALPKPQPVTLFLGLEEMKEAYSEAVPELAPCLSHFVYIAQSRDIPLDPKDVKPPLARWKLFRWLKWAIGEQIIDPVEYFVPIRSLKIVSPLKRCEESVINKYSGTNIEEDDATVDKSKTSKETSRSNKSKEPQKRTVLQLPDISFWADFNKMEPFVRDVHFFYKLDYFQYTTRLSDRFATRQASDQKTDPRKGSRKDSRKSSPTGTTTFKEPDFVDAYCWPQKMTKTKNEPLYLFTDSLEDKFFLVDFSTFQVSVETLEETIGETAYTKIMLKGNRDSLIMKRHKLFRRPKKLKYMLAVTTAGTKSAVVEMSRGRHLLQLFCHSESDCFVTISSDTSFYVGDRRSMYQLMCTESEMVEAIARRISNSIGNVYQAFGTERFPEALKAYYNSYLPPVEERNDRDIAFYRQIHNYFVKDTVKLIRQVMPEDEVPGALRALRVFFLNPAIGLESFDTITMLIKSLREFSLVKSLEQVDLKYSKEDTLNNAATVIQAFFKMIVVRKYKQIHDPRHKEHDEVSKSLLKIAELFNYNKRESLANQILRNILGHHDKLYDIYDCSRDFKFTLQVQELTGTLTNVKANQWLPIVRVVVNPRGVETVLANIDLFVNLARYCVRVFKNDTGQEILRIVNNVIPTRYYHSKLGYTIFCYGWSDDQAPKELPWSLQILTKKGQPMFQFIENEELLPMIAMPPELVTEELFNSYIPNSKNIISRWIVRVTKPSLVSFRLRVSYDKARMKFKVTDVDGHTLARMKGTSVVILPMVYLGIQKKSETIVLPTMDGVVNGKINENMEENSEEMGESTSKDDLTVPYTIYHAEASVLDDSWPLTRAEWSLVSEFRVKPTGSLVKTKLPSFPSTAILSKSRRSSRQTVDSVSSLESPYWILQVVTDSGSGLEISQDRTKEIEIARMKEAWAKENPDSLQRGRELREAFIKKHEIKPKTSSSSLEKKHLSHSEKSFTKKDSKRSLVIDSLETSMACLEERTLKPTPSLRRLPPLDLTVYVVREEEEDRPWVKTEADDKMLRNMRVMNMIYAQEDYTHFLDEMNNMFAKRKMQNRTLYGRYKDSFSEGRFMLDDAYDVRNEFISTTKPVPPSSNKSAKTIKSTQTVKKSKKV